MAKTAAPEEMQEKERVKKMCLEIKGGSMFDGLGQDWRKNVALFVTSGIITEKMAGHDYNVLDAEGCYILPGLINCHAHLIWDASPDPEEVIKDKTDAYVALSALREAQSHLKLGITTVRDLGSVGTSVLSLRDAINAGIVTGPNIVASGPPIAMTGGHVHRIGIEVDGVDRVRQAARLNLKNNVDFIKLMATGGVYTKGEEPGSPQLTVEEMQAAVEEAHKRGKKVTAHAEGVEGIKNALRAGVDGIEHGNYIDDEAIDLMVKNGTYFCPTIVVFIRMTGNEAKNSGVPDWAIKKAEQVVTAQKNSFPNAVQGGVKIITGTDYGAPLNTVEDYYEELELMRVAGMSNIEILKSSTSRAAEGIGFTDAGTLEIGKKGDILIVEDDALEDLNNLKKVRYVIKDGKVVVNNT